MAGSIYVNIKVGDLVVSTPKISKKVPIIWSNPDGIEPSFKVDLWDYNRLGIVLEIIRANGYIDNCYVKIITSTATGWVWAVFSKPVTRS